MIIATAPKLVAARVAFDAADMVEMSDALTFPRRIFLQRSLRHVLQPQELNLDRYRRGKLQNSYNPQDKAVKQHTNHGKLLHRLLTYSSC